MRVLWGISLLCVSASAAQKPIDFARLQTEVAQKGVQAVVHQGGDADEQLSSALTHVQPYVQEDPQQLWFQLQARTRFSGWEDFQKQLRAQTPDETLIALTSTLDSGPAGVKAVWRFGNQPVSHLGLSSDRKHIYCGSGGTFAVIDPQSLEVVRRFDNLGPVYTTLVGPNGDLFAAVASDHGGGAAPFDVRTGDEMVKVAAIRRNHGYLGNVPMPPAIITSPDGLKLIQEVREIQFQCRDIDGGGETIQFSSGGDKTFCNTVFMRFVDGGKMLLTADDRGHIRHFTFPDCKESRFGQKMTGARVTGYDLSSDESLLACGFAGSRGQGRSRTKFGEISIWDCWQGRELLRHEVPDDAPVSTVFLGDNESVVAGGFSGRLYAFQGDAARPIISAPHDSPVVRMVTAPDGKHVFSGDIKGFIKLSDPLSAGEPATALPTEPTIRQHGVSPDGAWETQISKRGFKVLQVATGRTMDAQLSDQDFAALGEITSIALNATKGYATIGGLETVLHYQLRTKRTKLVKLDVSNVPRQQTYGRRSGRSRTPVPKLPVIVTPDTKHAVLWGRKAVASFNAFTAENEFVLELPIRHLGRRYGFLSGERIAINYQTQGSSGRSEGIRIFDLAKRKEVANLEHGAFQRGIAIHPKTDTIVTSGRTLHGRDTPKLLFWDANSGQRKQQDLPEMYGDVIGISEDGTRFLTLATRPAVVFVWDMAAKKVIRRFDMGIDVTRGRLDGRTLVLTIAVGNDRIEHWFEYHQAQ